MNRPAENFSGALIRMPNWLGDCAMALPAIESLKAGFPQLAIDLLIKENLAGLGRLLPAVRKTIPLPAKGSEHRAQTLSAVRSAGYDMTIILPNSFRSAWELWTSRIPVRAGYAGAFRSFTLTHAVKPPARRSISQADYYQNLVSSVFPGLERMQGTLAVTSDMMRRSESLLPTTDKPCVGLGFGASYGSAKVWQSERYAALADRLSEFAQVILVGAETDRDMEKQVLAHTHSRPLSLVGKTDLPALAVVLKRLSAYITNDTGPMHIAAMLGTPVIALFGPTSPQETAPTADNSVVIYHGADCSPCWKRNCPQDHRCMTAISVDEVMENVEKIRQNR